MKDEDKTKKELIIELNEMRKRISDYEKLVHEFKIESVFKSIEPPSDKQYPFSEKTLIATTNLNFEITYCNNNTINVFGFLPEDVIGKTIKDICSGNNVVIEYEKIKNSIKKDGLFKYLLDRETKTGIQYLSFRVTGNWGKNNELLGYIFVINNVTNSVTKQKLLAIENRFSTSMNLVRNIDEAMEIFLDCAFKIVEIDSGGIYFVDPVTFEIHLQKAKGLSEKFIEEVSYFDGSSPQADIVKTGKPIFTSYSKIMVQRSTVRRNEGLKGIALIPIKHEGKIVAFVNLASKHWETFCELTKDTIVSISAQLGSTIGRIKAGKKLKISENRFRSIFSNISNIAVQGYNKNREIIFWNKASEQLYNYSAKEVLNKKIDEVIIPEEMKEEVIKLIDDWYNKNIPIPNGEVTLVGKGGIPVHVYSSHVMIENFDGEKEMFCIDIDISEQKDVKEKMLESLKEKEILLREVHHRVKNNMQIVMSLLNLQANTIEDENIRKALAESNNRISAMGLIHEVLYQSDNLSLINPDEYINMLIQSSMRIFGSADKNIKHELDIDKIELSLDDTIPLALIINELLTNTYKYAFPNRREGKIKIALKKKGNDEILLKYFDDGIGIMSEIIPYEIDSLGLKLVYDLAEGQLKGDVELDRSNGTCFKIVFKRKNK